MTRFCRNPFSKNCPQRLVVQHVERRRAYSNGTTNVLDRGVWINAQDSRGLSLVRPFLQKGDKRFSPPPILSDVLDIYDSVPFVLPVRELLRVRFTYYIPCETKVAGTEEEEARLDVVSNKYDIESDRRQVNLRLVGPSHLLVFVDARETQLTQWSQNGHVYTPIAHKNLTYIFQFITGTPPALFEFFMEAEGNGTIHIAYTAHYLEKKGPEVEKLENAFPEWVHSTAFASTWTYTDI